MSLKSTIEWNSAPPKGMSFQTHKFSLLDVIEIASMELGTDYTAQHETIVTGQKGRVILATLPHTVLDLGENGLLASEDGKAVLGKVGNRRILFDKSRDMFGKVVLNNGTDEVCIVIPEAKPGNLQDGGGI